MIEGLTQKYDFGLKILPIYSSINVQNLIGFQIQLLELWIFKVEISIWLWTFSIFWGFSANWHINDWRFDAEIWFWSQNVATTFIYECAKFQYFSNSSFGVVNF